MTKEDFILDVREAVKRNQVVLIMIHSTETDEFGIWSNAEGCEFDSILSALVEMPFTGRVSSTEAFEEWEEYVEDTALAEIYGFELEDGSVQMSILEYFLRPQQGLE